VKRVLWVALIIALTWPSSLEAAPIKVRLREGNLPRDHYTDREAQGAIADVDLPIVLDASDLPVRERIRLYEPTHLPVPMDLMTHLALRAPAPGTPVGFSSTKYFG
jgi:hypothetical protein